MPSSRPCTGCQGASLLGTQTREQNERDIGADAMDVDMPHALILRALGITCEHSRHRLKTENSCLVHRAAGSSRAQESAPSPTQLAPHSGSDHVQFPGDPIVCADEPGFIWETLPWEWKGRFQPWSWTFVFIQLCFVWRLCLFLNNAAQRTLRKSPGCDPPTVILSFYPVSWGESKEGKRKGRKEKEAPLGPLPCPSHQPRGFAQLNLNSPFQGFVGPQEDSHSSVLPATFFSKACRPPPLSLPGRLAGRPRSGRGRAPPPPPGAGARHGAARAPAAGTARPWKAQTRLALASLAFYVAAKGVHLNCQVGL